MSKSSTTSSKPYDVTNTVFSWIHDAFAELEKLTSQSIQFIQTKSVYPHGDEPDFAKEDDDASSTDANIDYYKGTG